MSDNPPNPGRRRPEPFVEAQHGEPGLPEMPEHGWMGHFEGVRDLQAWARTCPPFSIRLPVPGDLREWTTTHLDELGNYGDPALFLRTANSLARNGFNHFQNYELWVLTGGAEVRPDADGDRIDVINPQAFFATTLTGREISVSSVEALLCMVDLQYKELGPAEPRA